MTDLRSFLEPFAPEVRDRIASHAGGAVILGPHPELAEFRRTPERCLAVVSRSVSEVSRTAPATGRFIWCLTGDLTSGLERDEVEAVLDRFAFVEDVRETIS